MAKIRKRRQKQTLKEFRAWLQGVEELQPEGWSPDSDQWVLIRDKIDGVVEEKTVPPVVAPQQSVQTQHMPVTPQLPMISAPPPVGGVPHAEVAMSEAAKRMLGGGEGVTTKTPDIDTSDGNVNSSFA